MNIEQLGTGWVRARAAPPAEGVGIVSEVMAAEIDPVLREVAPDDDGIGGFLRTRPAEMARIVAGNDAQEEARGFSQAETAPFLDARYELYRTARIMDVENVLRGRIVWTCGMAWRTGSAVAVDEILTTCRDRATGESSRSAMKRYRRSESPLKRSPMKRCRVWHHVEHLPPETLWAPMLSWPRGGERPSSPGFEQAERTFAER